MTDWVRRWGRRCVGAFLGGVLLVSAAWAGVGLAPEGGGNGGVAKASAAARAAAAALAAQSDRIVKTAATSLDPPDLSALAPLPAGQFLVGAAVNALTPDAKKWQKQDCATEDDGLLDDPTYLVTHALEGHLPPGWPKTPNCIYMGGYGIGPSRVATGIDTTTGYNVRSLAISNGRRTVVWQMIDAVGYFAKYRADLCPDCGILDMRRRISTAIGMPVDNVAIGSTHTHGGFDGYGAWGGLPDWYRRQVRDAIVASAFDAVRAMRPAQIEIGDVNARAFSSQRRDTYYSAHDYGAVWLQARQLGGTGKAGQVIATLLNYGAHPTVLGRQTLLHGDWPATASKALGDQFGGTGLVIEGGLGNVSNASPPKPAVDQTGDRKVDEYDRVIQHGKDFVEFIGRDISRGGRVMTDNTIATKTTTIEHPGTSATQVAGTLGGLLDREYRPSTDGAAGPGVYRSERPGLLRACVTAAPVQVRTDVSGYRIGDLTVVTAPGEIFGGMSVVAKSQLRRGAVDGYQTMVFAQTQDSLGYIIQSYEVDAIGGLPSYADEAGDLLEDVSRDLRITRGLAEYEETFMIDNCFGDHVLEAMLAVGREL